MSGPRVIRVLAGNPSPLTLDGTNTWVLGERPSLVIDPGPEESPDHLHEILREARGVGAILLTHRHPDHAPGAAELSRVTGAPVLAFRPEPGERRLRDGQIVEGGGIRLRTVHTPGHTHDHVAFLEPDSGALFTGDAVLGRGTSVIDPPDGDLAAYLRSLRAMLALDPRTIHPGHGPVVWEAPAKLREYVEHRELREAQVVAALREGPRTPDEIVPGIYGDYPAEVRAFAVRSVLAHLLKLESEGRAARVGRRADERFRLAEPTACRRCGRPAQPGSTLCRRCGLEALQEGPVAGDHPDPRTT